MQPGTGLVTAYFSMLEMAMVGPDEHHAELFRGGQDLGVPLGSTRRHDGGDPGSGKQFDSIRKRKEGIRRRHRPDRSVPCLMQSPSGRPNPALVTGADPYGLPVSDQNDGIGSGMGRH